MLPSLEIEATNRCTLACPRCARTVLLEKFGKKGLPTADIDLTTLKNFIDLKLEFTSLCGVHGDPIYHPEFDNLLEILKDKSEYVNIFTNGSYRNKTWWKDICQTLEHKDTITFAIDGSPENFQKYRVNGDWKSILIGINECVNSSAKVLWQYIPFSYNEDDIEKTKKLSEELGFDEFYINYSDRWEKDDWLRPRNQNLVNNRDDLQDQFKNKNNKNMKIDPLCASNQKHYVSATGFYAPCCFSADPRFYYKNNWWKQRKRHNIKSTTLSEQIEFFDNFLQTIQHDRPEYCVYNCGKC